MKLIIKEINYCIFTKSEMLLNLATEGKIIMTNYHAQVWCACMRACVCVHVFVREIRGCLLVMLQITFSGLFGPTGRTVPLDESDQTQT